MQVRVVNIIFNNAILLFILDEPLGFFPKKSQRPPGLQSKARNIICFMEVGQVRAETDSGLENNCPVPI